MFKIMLKTVFKTKFKTVFKTLLKKNIANTNMSFLKITDPPKKRALIVSEFLKTRQNIQQNVLSERVGDLNTQYELSKLFKPVTEM